MNGSIKLECGVTLNYGGKACQGKTLSFYKIVDPKGLKHWFLATKLNFNIVRIY
jgi:hypothetical protein